MLSFLPLVDAMSYYYFSDRGPNNNWFICLDVFINSLQSLKNNTLLYLSGKEHMCHASCWGERTTCRSPFHFYFLGPRDGTQIIRLASKHLYLLSNVFSLSDVWLGWAMKTFCFLKAVSLMKLTEFISLSGFDNYFCINLPTHSPFPIYLLPIVSCIPMSFLTFMRTDSTVPSLPNFPSMMELHLVCYHVLLNTIYCISAWDRLWDLMWAVKNFSTFRLQGQDSRYGSAVKKACRGPEFSYQHSRQAAHNKPPRAPFWGDLRSAFILLEHLHTYHHLDTQINNSMNLLKRETAMLST